MQYKLIFTLNILLFGIVGNYVAADRYYEHRAQMLCTRAVYTHEEPRDYRVTVTVTDHQRSSFKKMTLPITEHTTYEILANIISSKFFSYGTLYVQQDHKLKMVTNSSGHCNATECFYFILDADQEQTKQGCLLAN